MPRRDVWSLLFACATEPVVPGDSGAPAADVEPTDAVLILAFEMDSDLSASMSELPQGVFRGSIYREDDADALGPHDGATSLVDIETERIDLAYGAVPTAWTSEPIEPQTLWVLGCLDSDDNDCECGDPITLPNDNKFAVVPGDNFLLVRMELLHPC